MNARAGGHHPARGHPFGIEDLRPPYGPGNPVDAALRTIRNEYERAGVFQTERSSPYPLLVVRPDGIKSYSLARNAMASWDDQFGYELIAADLPLAFPPSLPGMKEKLEQSMVVAKDRHQALLAALPAPLRRAAMEDDFDEPKIYNHRTTGVTNSRSIAVLTARRWIKETETGTLFKRHRVLRIRPELGLPACWPIGLV